MIQSDHPGAGLPNPNQGHGVQIYDGQQIQREGRYFEMLDKLAQVEAEVAKRYERAQVDQEINQGRKYTGYASSRFLHGDRD